MQIQMRTYSFRLFLCHRSALNHEGSHSKSHLVFALSKLHPPCLYSLASTRCNVHLILAIMKEFSLMQQRPNHCHDSNNNLGHSVQYMADQNLCLSTTNDLLGCIDHCRHVC